MNTDFAFIPTRIRHSRASRPVALGTIARTAKQTIRASALSAAVLIMAAAATPAAAQSVNCATDQSQSALNICAHQAWQRADADLNALWGVLKPRADRAGWGQRLLEEQRAWLRTRDARCESERDQFAGGSIAPQVYWSCMEQMTLRRNADFRSMM